MLDAATEDVPEEPAAAQVRQIRDSIKRFSGLDDSEGTTRILGISKSERLQQLNRDLDAAQEALRDSKPLTKQQSQAEAHLRKLQKTLDADKAKLLAAEEAVQAAQKERDVQLAAVAETQTKVDIAKKSAADIASRLAAELGAAPPPTSQLFHPGTPEWGALEDLEM